MSRPRPVVQQTCRSCAAPVLRGLDADVAGITVEVDPSPVDNLGEAVAVLTGRRTFSLRVARSDRGQVLGRQIEQRSAATIRGSVLRFPVHAEHRCDAAPLPVAEVDVAVTSWPEEVAF